MEQLLGFVAQEENSTLSLRLKESFYGLKQSPRFWFGQFSSVVMECGLKTWSGPFCITSTF